MHIWPTNRSQEAEVGSWIQAYDLWVHVYDTEEKSQMTNSCSFRHY